MYFFKGSDIECAKISTDSNKTNKKAVNCKKNTDLTKF